jgi:thiaminase
MGMTNKQFQGFIRLALNLINKAVEKSPENQELAELKDIFQTMLEDD